MRSLTTAYRASAHQVNWKQQHNCIFQELLPDQVEHMELECAVHTEKTAMLFTED